MMCTYVSAQCIRVGGALLCVDDAGVERLRRLEFSSPRVRGGGWPAPQSGLKKGFSV